MLFLSASGAYGAEHLHMPRPGKRRCHGRAAMPCCDGLHWEILCAVSGYMSVQSPVPPAYKVREDLEKGEEVATRVVLATRVVVVEDAETDLAA